MNKNLVILFSLVAVIALLYLVMFINTNSIVDDVRNVMLGKVEKSVTDNSPLSMYNRRDELDTVSVDVEITRIFVLHNFFKGYMWVRYTCEGFDENGNRTYGSWKVRSLWKIHRENGKWQIVDIWESP